MNAKDIDIESVLNTKNLTQCPAITGFARDLPSSATLLKIRGVHVSLYYRDRYGVVIVDYPAGMCVRDTAFSGDLESVHNAVVRLARHTDATVVRDDFEILDEEDDQR